MGEGEVGEGGRMNDGNLELLFAELPAFMRYRHDHIIGHTGRCEGLPLSNMS